MNVSAIAPDSRRFTWLSRLVLACAAILLLALAFAPQQAHAAITADGWGYDLLTEEEQGIDGITIIDYVGDEADIALPAEIDGIPVVDATIGNDAVRSIDATACSELDSLTLYTGEVESLDVSGCSKLRWLACSGNKLKSLDLTGCTGLSILHCEDNLLTELDISDCPNLEFLHCTYNHIADTSALLAWADTVQDSEGIEILPQYEADSGFAYLVQDGDYGYGAYITGWSGEGSSITIPAQLGSVDVVSVNMKHKGLESVDVSKCPSLKYLDCSLNHLETGAYYQVESWLEEEGHEGVIQPQIDAATSLLFEVRDGDYGYGAYVIGQDVNDSYKSVIAVPESLRDGSVVAIAADQIHCTLLDVTQCSELQSIALRYSDIDTLNASGLSGLETLTCGTSRVYALNVADCDSLRKIDCSYNHLSSLSFPGCSALQELDCTANNITSIDLSGCPELSSLKCAKNLLDKKAVAALVEKVPNAVVSQQGDTSNIENVKLNATNLALAREETFQLEARSYADDKPMVVTWESTDESVASVDENGLVTAHKKGYATITARSEDGWARGACLVAVTNKSIDSDVKSMSFEAKQCDVDFVSKCPLCGKSHSDSSKVVLSLVPAGAEGLLEDPDVQLTYDEAVIGAGVFKDSESGALEVHFSSQAIGTTELTAFVENSDGSKVEATIKVTVREAAAPTFSMPSERAYRIDESAPVVKHFWAGAGEDFEPLVNLDHFPGMVTSPHNDGSLHEYERYLKSVSSSDESVVSFAEGAMLDPGESQPDNVLDSYYLVMDLKKPGTATITVEDIWGHKGSCKVTVNDVSVDFDKNPIMLKPGESIDLMTKIKGGIYSWRNLDFVSSDESIASIEDRWNDETEKREFILTGEKNGSATVTVRYGTWDTEKQETVYREFGTIPVTVATPVESVALSETEKMMQVGDKSFTLTATVSPMGASDAKVTWSSSNDKVAKVDAKGAVTPVAAGKAEITATAGGKSAKCVVTVKAKQVASTDSGSAVAGSVAISNSSSASDEALMEKLEGLGLAIEPVKPAESEPVKQAVAAIVQAGGDVVEVLDIHFTDENGDEVAWSDDKHVLTVRIAMTDAMKELAKTQDLVVFYIDENGERTEMPTWIEGDELVFQTTHFSTYAVAGVPQQQPDDPDDPDDGNGGGNQGGNQGQGDNNQGDNGNGNGSSTDNDKGGAQGADKAGDTASNGGTLAVMGDPLGVTALAVAATALAAVLALAFAARRRVR